MQLRPSLRLISAVGMAVGLLSTAPGQALAQKGGGELVVSNDRTKCPEAQFVRIQDAVNAAPPGATIRVCPGTYVEQVTIPNGKDGLTLVSQEPQAAVILAPPAMLPPYAIVRVAGAHDVTLRAFTVSGPSAANGCSDFYGVRVDMAGTATLTNNLIQDIRNANPALLGCQSGVGVLVGRRFQGQTGSATISHNTIVRYQKAGVVVDNSGSSADIDHNTIQGSGPTNVIAQNGIQISRGATAELQHNSVSANQYTVPTDSATGILLYHPGVATVAHNTVTNNDNGVYADVAPNAVIQHNDISRNTYDGIDLLDGTTNADVSFNESYNNASDGIYVDSTSTNNTLSHNRLHDNGVFDAQDDSHDAHTAGTANTWAHNQCATSSPPGLCSN